jgi:hypothetical protein
MCYIFLCTFQVCVNIDKEREKRRVSENWRRKKHEEKKRTILCSFSFFCFTCSLASSLIEDAQLLNSIKKQEMGTYRE